ncbi:MAG TPA: hypothetical protein VL688_10615 [Verrucomicrobiae bacterium]|jgi:hypothetical protein|nr:hypothetical protein [Verrucomicrobiae bacterium]
MSRKFFLLLVLGFALMRAAAAAEPAKAPSSAPSQAAPDGSISVKAELDKAFITIGDPVQYTVTIRHAPDVLVLSNIPYPPADVFKIKKIEEFSNDDGGYKVEGKKFNLTTFQLGEFILDPIVIEYRAKGAEVQKIQTARIFLTVKSVAGDKVKTDIRGIKSIVSIPKQVLGLILVGLLVLALLLIPVIRRWLRKRALQPKAPERILSAEEAALVELNKLFDSDLLRLGKIKDYYFRLSEILRIYLEKRHNITAIESTTFEILQLLKQKDISGQLRNKIKEVLEFADLAKFAKWRPEPAEVITFNKRSKEIIEESTPVEPKPSHGV